MGEECNEGPEETEGDLTSIYNGCYYSKLKFSLSHTTSLTLLYVHHFWNHLLRHSSLSLAVKGRCTTVYFGSLHQAVLCLQNMGQLTCSHTSTPESICKSLPGGVVTGDQPSLEHLQELISGILILYSDTVQCTSSHLELKSKGIPVCRHIHNFLQDLTKVIQGQPVS